MAHNFGLFFNQRIDYVLILTKMGLATFWAIFSQTHLVALFSTQVLCKYCIRA
jgi:hypothetical protein